MASIRQYLDQLLKPAKYNPENYATMSLEELEAMKKVHEEHQAQEVQEAQRKPRAHRQRQSRINMAFSDENMEYLRIISRVEDTSITNYVNELLDKERVARAQDVLKARRVMKVREE